MFLSCGGLAETDDETEFVGQLELALKENQGNLHALAKLLNTVMPDEGNSRSGQDSKIAQDQPILIPYLGPR